MVIKYSTNKVSHKTIVRYLGIHLGFKLNYNQHVKLQTDKAQRVFISHKRMFDSKDFDSRVKLLCYKLLI